MALQGFSLIFHGFSWIWHGFGRFCPARVAFVVMLASFGAFWGIRGRLGAFGGQSEPKLIAMTPRAAKLWSCWCLFVDCVNLFDFNHFGIMFECFACFVFLFLYPGNNFVV